MSTHRFLAALAILFLGGVSGWAQRPANDQFNGRMVLLDANLSVTATNTNASKQNGEPDHAGNVGGRSLWWSWTAPADGEVIITTDGSDFDTLLGVYTGTSVSSLSLVSSNDDHGVFVTSRVRFETVGGTEYQIAIDGFSEGTNFSSGTVVLNLGFSAEPIPRLRNDAFADRINLEGAAVAVEWTNVNARREPGEPLHAGMMGDTSVWWTWTAPESRTVVVSTAGSRFDTLLAVYTGVSISNLTVVAANDDRAAADGVLTSEVTFDAVGGQAYQIAVDGWDGDAGQIKLQIGPAAPLLQGSVAADGAAQVSFTGIPGRTYGVEASLDLEAWEPVAEVVNTNGFATFTDTSATNHTRRFYRALLKTAP